MRGKITNPLSRPIKRQGGVLRNIPESNSLFAWYEFPDKSAFAMSAGIPLPTITLSKEFNKEHQDIILRSLAYTRSHTTNAALVPSYIDNMLATDLELEDVPLSTIKKMYFALSQAAMDEIIAAASQGTIDSYFSQEQQDAIGEALSGIEGLFNTPAAFPASYCKGTTLYLNARDFIAASISMRTMLDEITKDMEFSSKLSGEFELADYLAAFDANYTTANLDCSPKSMNENMKEMLSQAQAYAWLEEDALDGLLKIKMHKDTFNYQAFVKTLAFANQEIDKKQLTKREKQALEIATHYLK